MSVPQVTIGPFVDPYPNEINGSACFAVSPSIGLNYPKRLAEPNVPLSDGRSSSLNKPSTSSLSLAP